MQIVQTAIVEGIGTGDKPGTVHAKGILTEVDGRHYLRCDIPVNELVDAVGVSVSKGDTPKKSVGASVVIDMEPLVARGAKSNRLGLVREAKADGDINTPLVIRLNAGGRGMWFGADVAVQR